MREWYEAARAGRPVRIECRFQDREGAVTRVQSHARPVRDASGRHTGHMGVLLDVTEERTLAASLAVRSRLAALGTFVAGMAHEINNPLAGIRTYARLLRRQFAAGAAAPPSPEQAKETDRILQMVDGEAGRCGDIVRNLLAFSRQSGARLAEEDLSPVVERCRMLLKHQAEMLSVTLETRVEPDLPKVVCDAAQVQQVILALAMNALEATPSDGRVSIEASREGDGVRLAVSDTGWGIPKDHLDRIFEPFFTTKEAGKGVGLGLAVVYGIVSAHHGRIDVASEPGRGTTFTVHLPARQPEAVAAADGGPGLVGD
jgi:two-component system NtrC family sensor kinase